MELQFNKTSLPCLRQAAWEVQTQEQTQEVRLPDAMPDIGKVLACWGQVLMRGKEWRTGSMSVSGGVMAWVLYAPEDGSDARSVEAWIPFQMKWDFPDTERDGTIRAACLLKGVDARSVSARKLIVRTNVSVVGEALEPTQVDIFAPGEVPEDVQLLRKNYPMKLPREAGEKAFVLDEELTIPSSAPPVEKIIRMDLQPELIDQKVMAGKVVFRGVGNLHILYRTEDGSLKTWDFEIPFSQYTDLERDYDQDAAARVTLAVTSLELEHGEGDVLRLKAGLVGQYIIYDRPMIEIVEDAYSPNRQVVPQIQSLELPTVLDERRETMRAEAEMPAEGAQVVDLTFLPEHPKMRSNAGGVELEIPGSFQLLSYGENGSLQSGSAHWEGKMNISAGEDSRVEAVTYPTGRPQGSLGGGTANVRGDVLLDMLTTARQGMPMVTALDMGELTEPDPARPSLILRRAGEEGLWGVAKRCGSTVDAIREANHLQEEPNAEQILLIPVL